MKTNAFIRKNVVVVNVRNTRASNIRLVHKKASPRELIYTERHQQCAKKYEGSGSSTSDEPTCIAPLRDQKESNARKTRMTITMLSVADRSLITVMPSRIDHPQDPRVSYFRNTIISLF